MLDKGTRDEIISMLEQEREAVERKRHHYRQKGGAGIDRFDELEKTYYEHATLASMFECAQWTMGKAITRIKAVAVADKDEVSGIFPEWQALDHFMRDTFPGEYEVMSKQGLPVSRVAIGLLGELRKVLDLAAAPSAADTPAADTPAADTGGCEVIAVDAGMSSGAAESTLIADTEERIAADTSGDFPGARDGERSGHKKGGKGRRR